MGTRKPFGCITVLDAAVVLDVPEEVLAALLKRGVIPVQFPDGDEIRWDMVGRLMRGGA